MSTRSVMARMTGDGWAGPYCHFDGYPEGRLPVIREELDKRAGDVELFLKELVDSVRQGWSSFAETAYEPDGEMWHTNAKTDPLMIEWVYVLDPQSRKMAVFTLRRCPDHQGDPSLRDGDFSRVLVECPNRCTQYFHCAYFHELVAVLSLDDSLKTWMAAMPKDDEE